MPAEVEADVEQFAAGKMTAVVAGAVDLVVFVEESVAVN